jgi:hypothetical protein
MDCSKADAIQRKLPENFNAPLAKFWDYVNTLRPLGRHCLQRKITTQLSTKKESLASWLSAAPKESHPDAVKAERAVVKRKIELDDSAVDWESMLLKVDFRMQE